MKSKLVLNFLILFVLISIPKLTVAECTSQNGETESKSETQYNQKYSEVLEGTNANTVETKRTEDGSLDISVNISVDVDVSADMYLRSTIFDIRFDKLPKQCDGKDSPKNCAEATACTQRSGIYKLLVPAYSYEPFYVECDAETECGDWIVIQRRQDGSVDFFRNWEEYENGFGDVESEYFIGLKKLNALTTSDGPQELLILMEDKNNTVAFAKYDSFAIGNAEEQYKLKKLGRYTGTAGNSLVYDVGMYFSTKDKNNAPNEEFNCAEFYMGAWWYNECHETLFFGSNLNGKYNDNRYGKGLIWETYNGLTNSLQYIKMMIRRRRY